MMKDLNDINKLDKNNLTVTCTTNERYVPFLKAFLNSLLMNSKNTQVVVRLVNVSESTTSDLLMTYDFDNIIFLEDIIQIDQKRTTLLDVAENKTYKELLKRVKKRANQTGCHDFISNEGAYCSNIKFNTMNHLLSLGFDVVMYLDVDTLVRDDINHMKDMMIDHDIGMYIDSREVDIYKTYHGDTYTGFSAGLMLVKRTDLSRHMYKLIENRVMENIHNIEADEDEFDLVYKMFEDTIKMQRFGDRYKDQGPDFRDNSYMWSGKSEAKGSNGRYIEEYNNYLHLKNTRV